MIKDFAYVLNYYKISTFHEDSHFLYPRLENRTIKCFLLFNMDWSYFIEKNKRRLLSVVLLRIQTFRKYYG